MNRIIRPTILVSLFLLQAGVGGAGQTDAVTGLPVAATDEGMRVVCDDDTGQIDIFDQGRPVLRYNYRTVDPPEGYIAKVHAGARKYARPRSNYIHPLYGPDGEDLTADWSPDHPHHRGIYWAWPEVRYQDALGDLHALQRVFAHPTGKIEMRRGDDFAQVRAESEWRWEDKTPIVREVATIRAWQTGAHGRYVDLQFEFTALEDDISLARRGTKHYGGLNMRLARVNGLQLTHHADPPQAAARAAWQLASGTWEGAKSSASLTVLEHAGNPHYPGDYVEYPNLPWFQPTFPSAGTRCVLKKDQPLALKYRLWIRGGGVPVPARLREQWNIYNTLDTKESPE